MTRKLGLSKLRSDRIFIDFSLQRELEREDWCMVKWNLKMFCQQQRFKSFPQRGFCEPLIWDLHYRQPRSHFSCRPGSLDKVTLSLGRGSQLDTKLMLVDTSWHWVDTEPLCPGAQQVVGAGIGTETQSCIVVIIVRGNLTLSPL